MGPAVRTSFGGPRAGIITSQTIMFAPEGVALTPTRRFIKVVSFKILALVALMVIFASTGEVLAPWSRTGPRSSRGRGHRYPGSGDPGLSWASHPPTQVQSVKRTGVTVHRSDVLPMLGVRGGGAR